MTGHRKPGKPCIECGEPATYPSARLCDSCYGKWYRKMVQARRQEKIAAATALREYMPQHMERLRELGRV
jgi:NMD protein affecting ribosome stability and mRNA decay